MRVYIWDFILVYVLGESMSRSFDFCERVERPFYRISGSLPYLSLHPFLCDLSSCFDVDWPSLTFLSFCLLLSLSYSSVSLYLIWFLFFLVLLDVWLGFSIHTVLLLIWCVYSFIITFCVRILKSATHDVFYALHLMHEGYGDYIIGAYDRWYGDYWIISCSLHRVLGHSHLVRYFDIETWLSVYDYCFW